MADQGDPNGPVLQRDIRRLREEMGVHVGNLLQGIQSINAYLHGGAMDIIARAPGQHAEVVHELQTLHKHAGTLYEEARRLHGNDASQVQEIGRLNQHIANLIDGLKTQNQTLTHLTERIESLEVRYMQLQAEHGDRLSSVEWEIPRMKREFHEAPIDLPHGATVRGGKCTR